MHAKKKTFTYKEQCPVKQETYLTQLQMALVNGKTPVFVDESGFSTESVRQSAYAPRGVCVSDKISSNRYRCTTLIAAQIQGRFTAPVLFEGGCMHLPSMRGLRTCCVRYLTHRMLSYWTMHLSIKASKQRHLLLPAVQVYYFYLRIRLNSILLKEIS